MTDLIAAPVLKIDAEAEIQRLIAERDALQKRIDEAPRGTITNRHSSGAPDSLVIHDDLPADSWGKRVRLVVEEPQS